MFASHGSDNFSFRACTSPPPPPPLLVAALCGTGINPLQPSSMRQEQEGRPGGNDLSLPYPVLLGGNVMESRLVTRAGSALLAFCSDAHSPHGDGADRLSGRIDPSALYGADLPAYTASVSNLAPSFALPFEEEGSSHGWMMGMDGNGRRQHECRTAKEGGHFRSAKVALYIPHHPILDHPRFCVV